MIDIEQIELYQEKLNINISLKNGKFRDVLTIFTKHKKRLQVLFLILKTILFWFWERKLKNKIFIRLKIYGEKRIFLRRVTNKPSILYYACLLIR